MTTRFATLIGARRQPHRITITGIAQSTSRSTTITQCTIRSRLNAYTARLNFVILGRITGKLPVQSVAAQAIRVPDHLELADPDFHTPGRIDILLGAELFLQWLCLGQFRPDGCTAVFQKTVFGWIVSGRMTTEVSRPNNIQCLTAINTEDLNALLKKFWEIEEINTSPMMSQFERRCEEHYEKTTKRDQTGRYTVHLPINHEVLKQIGDTRGVAVHRFYSLERKFEKNPEFKKAYCQFMREYEELKHMHPEGTQPALELPQVYLPHHGVIRADSTTTRLRVVFDASAKSTTGISLNDALWSGPNVQDDILLILLRFRIHRYVMTGDLEKMYRQINVHEPHTQLQKIIWRRNPDEPLQTFDLATVTYGTAAAPYLATRTLLRLAQDEKEQFPQASSIISQDFYVDDLLTGADNLSEALNLQSQLIKVCLRGGFRLRKWCANHPSLLSNLPDEEKGTVHQLNTNEGQSIKPLGIYWNPFTDELHYQQPRHQPGNSITKRTIISETTKLFDPLGLIGPVIARAKIIIQTLWRLQLSWDESLPMELHSKWEAYKEELMNLNRLRIPRRAISGTSPTSLQLHVFCDASERAYGACAYVRSSNGQGNISSHLLCSKSRVSPLKIVTIPRLELCAALLASKLITKTAKAVQQRFDACILWTDSTIVLCWLRDVENPRKWKQFVANRVAEIHELTGEHEWRHVRSEDNPADHLSRGLGPTDLMECALWWYGPSWLSKAEDQWPTRPTVLLRDPLPETRQHSGITMTATEATDSDSLWTLLTRYSRLEKLQRVTAYCLRFINNCSSDRNRRQRGNLTVDELDNALRMWIRRSQADAFGNELHDLRQGRQVQARSRSRPMNPFIDKSGILRVGGRLQHSEMTFDTKHPILLVANDTLAKLIINFEHRRLLHAGPQQLVASLRQRYWMIGIRDATRKAVHACVICHRWKARTAAQLMGSLPATRTVPAPAFQICGVDYAGPLTIRHGNSRSKVTTKAYVALFICFVTRAIHLELVSDLSTDSFLAAFHRFIARRGHPREVNSDNGTTFQGACRQLGQFLQSEACQTSITYQATQVGIKWNFIPAHSPHFGGLWEAGIKATKHHLRRVIGHALLNFEEMYTVLTQIEAVLNSRPILPASTDCDDLETLTPGHFLIHRAITTIPEPDYTQQKCLRTRWHLIQQMVQHFWKRWHKEYLVLLQNRPKWTGQKENLKPGTLVLIKEDNQPPLSWSRGRVVAVHPGKDGLTRVATVKTASGILRRPIVKLSPLPNQ